MTEARASILVVDDETTSLSSMKVALEDEFDIFTASNTDEARRIMGEEWIQVIICDHCMPGQTGAAFLSEVSEAWPETVRLIITSYTDLANKIQAINGAEVQQLITKPWHPGQLRLVARNAVRLFKLARENERMSLEIRYLTTSSEKRLGARRDALKQRMGFEGILRGSASPMNGLIRDARRFATFHVPILLTGEAGTGKEEIARAIHLVSLRSDKPFFVFNLTGVPDEIIEVELFGAKRGMMPDGANKAGLLRKADRGTIYLGGIDNLSSPMQLRILRAVQDGLFSPLGVQETMTTDSRLILGAHRPLEPLVESGAFRSDLYHAISTGNLRVPALRERCDDIGLIVDQMISDLSNRHGKLVTGIEPAALTFLENYDWPGNLPELENELTRMLIMAQNSVLSADLLSQAILHAPQPEDRASSPYDRALFPSGLEGTLKDQVEHVETRILRAALTRNRWNKSRAANELGLSRVGLRAKLERLGIVDPSGKSESDAETEVEEV